MNKFFVRLAIIIACGVVLCGYTFPWARYGIQVPFSEKEYKLGLDLQWWVELDYKVDLEEAKKEKDYTVKKENEILEGLKFIIDKRIQELQINDSVITTANYAGEQHIIVQIPLKWKNPEEDAMNIERAKKAIWKVMRIEFKERRWVVTAEDTAKREALSQKAFWEVKKSKYDFVVTASKYKDNYANVEVGKLDTNIDHLKTYFELDEKTLETWLMSQVITGKGIGILWWQDGYWIVKINKIYHKEKNTDAGKISEKNLKIDYIFLTKTPSEWKPAQDSQWRVLNDKYFVRSSVQFNEAFQPMIELTFNDEGAKIFGELSTRLVNQQMAIFVWWELLTAPNINEPIRDGKAVITWSDTVEQMKITSQNINTGVVPAAIYLTSEKSIDSKLGSNSLQKLLIAGWVGFLLIFIFLIVVYRTSGFLASIALLLYIVIILSIVKLLDITLTLASIAGLILSIGMAIDANILIFERIRDEISKWEKLYDAAKIGFKKSWSAIWDSNVTGLIVALILFIFWINLIKWFGLMLAIWIMVSLFSVMWISRILVFLAAKWSKNKKTFIGYKK